MIKIQQFRPADEKFHRPTFKAYGPGEMKMQGKTKFTDTTVTNQTEESNLRKMPPRRSSMGSEAREGKEVKLSIYEKQQKDIKHIIRQLNGTETASVGVSASIASNFKKDKKKARES